MRRDSRLTHARTHAYRGLLPRLTKKQQQQQQNLL